MSWVGIKEVSEHTGASPHTVRKWCQKKAIPHGRAGRLLVFNLDAVDTWIRQRGSSGRLDTPPTEDETQAQEAHEIADAILAGV